MHKLSFVANNWSYKYRGSAQTTSWFFYFADNQEVTRTEFENDWLTLYQLGNAREANLLFNKADANGDGHLTHADMPLIYSYFDMNSKISFTILHYLILYKLLKNSLGDVEFLLDNLTYGYVQS